MRVISKLQEIEQITRQEFKQFHSIHWGSVALGGNSTLEYSTGALEASQAYNIITITINNQRFFLKMLLKLLSLLTEYAAPLTFYSIGCNCRSLGSQGNGSVTENDPSLCLNDRRGKFVRSGALIVCRLFSCSLSCLP